MKKSTIKQVVLLLFLGTITIYAAEEAAGHNITHMMTNLMLQLGVILCAAKIGGFICKRYLKIPDVLGELGAGILISPYMFGPYLWGLFKVVESGGMEMAMSVELYGVATLASIILLFLAGLETDVSLFLRYSVVGSVVGIGGLLASFFLGAGVAVFFIDSVTSIMDVQAMFLGAISAATSVGITARVLSERNKLDSPEGVTILAGAVIDDVLGIILLAIVLGIARASGDGGNVAWGTIGKIAATAIGFWVVSTTICMLLAKRISKYLEFFKDKQTMATIALGLALLLAGLAEKAGLAMIIGAYIMGLALSRADSAQEMMHRLEPVHDTIVGVFFVVLGMMVNIKEMNGVIVFGLVYTLFAIIAKVVGCGVPALFMKFTPLGALRIGFGMLPRGEVALIIASIGLTSGVVGKDIFGVAIMMTLITTIIAPLVMNKIFTDKSGCKVEDEEEKMIPIALDVPNAELADFLINNIVKMFTEEECYVHQLIHGEPVYQIRKDDMVITMKYDGKQLSLSCGKVDREYARLMLMEALASLIMTFNGLRKMGAGQGMRNQIMGR